MTMITTLKFQNFILPVYALASTNCTHYSSSVPELTNLIISIDGISEIIIFARVISNSVGAPKVVPILGCLNNLILLQPYQHDLKSEVHMT